MQAFDVNGVVNRVHSNFQMCMPFVEIVMSIYRKYRDMIERIFQSDKSFFSALDRGCISIVNNAPDTKNYKSPELVSKVAWTD